MAGKEGKNIFPVVILLVAVFMSAAILAAGYLAFRYFEKQERIESAQQLAAIADLKTGEIIQWRKERFGDAAVFNRNPAFSALVERYFDNPHDADAGAQIHAWMAKVHSHYQYDRLCLHDADGRGWISIPDEADHHQSQYSLEANKILQSGAVAFEDFHVDPHNHGVYLSVLAPVLDPQTLSIPIGILVMRIDPENYLYPLINRWPTPSPTAETLIVRREGGMAAFLNAVRFDPDSALKRMEPLTKKTLPAVMAVSGKQGIVEGLDYRNQKVLADIRPIPDSPWFMVAKIDLAEVYAPIRDRMWWLIILVTALLIATVAVAGLIWRHQRARFFKEKYEMTDALRESEERLRAVVANLERSNRELEQFAYVASHDLQEPLRMVSSYTQLLARHFEGQLDEKAKKYIDYAVDGAVRMGQLINDLLVFARVGTRGTPFKSVDTHALLGVVIKNLSVSIAEARVMVTNDDLPVVWADASQLTMVFQNLVANAIKFRGETAPHIHVSAAQRDREWVFSVKDNGIGIDEKYKDRIFIIFQRLHTREEYPGTGIGLAICMRIIERHGGRIWFESEPGQGATFFFTIPKNRETTFPEP
ncbi:MAG: hypothetical protein C4548_12175 [Desulfobacteraceae bacterium]|jgi:signal transduction histidine kinase|nr:MAG: hypothetical protein C4548_12175 [Desulfobacteraceae bacterium]